MAIEHKNIPDAELHQVKGAASALDGQILSANGDGTATFKSFDRYMGWWDYGDLATSSTPIALTAANTKYDLTNDGLGAGTNTSYGLPNVSPVWNTSTNRFDFSDLDIGDTVDIRVDLDLITSANNDNILISMEFGVGDANAFSLNLFDSGPIKAAGTKQFVFYTSFYLGSAFVRDFPARLQASSDSTGDSVIVNGWYTRVLKRSLG